MSVALCKKIWTLLLESGILGFGICITMEIRNPSSTDKESIIQYLKSRIQDFCRLDCRCSLGGEVGEGGEGGESAGSFPEQRFVIEPKGENKY